MRFGGQTLMNLISTNITQGANQVERDGSVGWPCILSGLSWNQGEVTTAWKEFKRSSFRPRDGLPSFSSPDFRLRKKDGP